VVSSIPTSTPVALTTFQVRVASAGAALVHFATLRLNVLNAATGAGAWATLVVVITIVFCGASGADVESDDEGVTTDESSAELESDPLGALDPLVDAAAVADCSLPAPLPLVLEEQAARLARARPATMIEAQRDRLIRTPVQRHGPGLIGQGRAQ
jgi:hypothetical protein